MAKRNIYFVAIVVIFGVLARVQCNDLIQSDQNPLALDQDHNNNEQRKIAHLFEDLINIIDSEKKNHDSELEKIITSKRGYKNSNRRHHLSRWDIGFGKRDAPTSFFESLFDGKLSKKFDRGQQIWDVAYGK